jgi:hypothetical protein
MQKMTTFLFFAIGLLAFVQAFPSISSGGNFAKVESKKDKAATDKWNKDLANYEITPMGLEIKPRNGLPFLQPWSTSFYDNHVYDPDNIKKSEPNRKGVAINSLLTKAQLVKLYLDRSENEANGKNGGPSVLDNVVTQYRYHTKSGEIIIPSERSWNSYEVKDDYYRGRKVWNHLWVNNVDEDELQLL